MPGGWSFLCALDVGSNIESEFIFLEKNVNPYYPDFIFSCNATLFLQHSFVFKNGSLVLAPGFFIASEYSQKKLEMDKITVLPYFRRLNLSLFAKTFSFVLAKDAISFGEGFFAVNRYFFLNIPVKNTSDAMYHTSFEVAIKEVLLNFGSTLDTYSLDRYKKPQWYSIWTYASYSNAIMTLSLASDMLFEKHKILRFASEASFFLPYELKIYSSATLPINLDLKKIDNWGVFLGLNKSFIFDDYSLASVLGSSYGSDGWRYSIFQNLGIKEIVSFNLGLTGKNIDSLNLVCEGELSISTFSFKIGFVTYNFLAKKRKTKEDMRGLLTFGISLNE